MAIYHFSGTAISRSQGRSAVACAAYRSGERLVDERYDVVHDYTRKKDVVHRQILLPSNAPQELSYREQLWNSVEAHEKRKDAQLAREFNFALPKELTLIQNTDLARAFVQAQFVDKGMIADLTIHVDKTEEGELYHAHVMLTMRQITPEGFGPKVRTWNQKEQLLAWREAWSMAANHHLALHGHDVQIDHRTLVAQSIPLEPQYKIGPTASRAQMARLEDHQRIARENGERLLAYPEIALKALTHQQSTFTHHDIARFVNRHTADAEQFERVYERVKHQETLVRLGVDEKGRERFTSQEMLTLETAMLTQTKALSSLNSHPVSKDATRKALSTRTLTAEQVDAFQYLTQPESLRCVIGYAGTGKSYLLGAARESWERSGYQVKGVTLSGIAAETLVGSSGIESRTLASRLYYWDRGLERLTSQDILVVDEAGMLGSRQMARIIAEVNHADAKLVLIGDTQQLQAIEAGAAFRAIVQQTGFVELTEIRRQRIAWQAEATKEFARGHIEVALQRYEQGLNLHEFQTQTLAKAGIVSLWNDVRLSQPHQTQILLAYTRADVRELNEQARTLRKAHGELGREDLFHTERGERLFAEQDRIYFLKNDRSLGVMNGTLGTIEAIHSHELVVRLDDKENLKEHLNKKTKEPITLTINLNTYNHLDHGYAATVHKAQGITVDRAYVLSSRYLDAHATYVGMSRHRESVDLFWSREEFPNIQALSHTLSRDRAKDVSLDYGESAQGFAVSRGIEREVQPLKSPTIQEPLLSNHETLSPHQQNIPKPLTHPLKNRARPFDNALNPLKSSPGHLDLKAFKAQYEAENPARAKALAEAIRPLHEQTALAVEREFARLEKALETEKPEIIQALLKKEALLASQQPDVMDYLKTNHEAVAQKIQKLIEPPQKSLERGPRISLTLERGGIER